MARCLPFQLNFEEEGERESYKEDFLPCELIGDLVF